MEKPFSFAAELWFTSICLLVAFLVIASCTKPVSNSKLVEAEFNIADSLLQDSSFFYLPLGINLKMPNEWNEIHSRQKDSLAQVVLERTNQRIISVFKSTIDSSVSMILDATEHSIQHYDSLQNFYSTWGNLDDQQSVVQKDEFLHQCYRVTQYVVQDTKRLTFRLIYYNLDINDRKPRFEIIYSADRKNLNKNIRSIESSIGSVNC